MVEDPGRVVEGEFVVGEARWPSPAGVDSGTCSSDVMDYASGYRTATHLHVDGGVVFDSRCGEGFVEAQRRLDRFGSGFPSISGRFAEGEVGSGQERV